jgi:hypothetical protein
LCKHCWGKFSKCRTSKLQMIKKVGAVVYIILGQSQHPQVAVLMRMYSRWKRYSRVDGKLASMCQMYITMSSYLIQTLRWLTNCALEVHVTICCLRKMPFMGTTKQKFELIFVDCRITQSFCNGEQNTRPGKLVPYRRLAGKAHTNW